METMIDLTYAHGSITTFCGGLPTAAGIPIMYEFVMLGSTRTLCMGMARALSVHCCAIA